MRKWSFSMQLYSEAGKYLLWIEEGRKGHMMLRHVLKGCPESCCAHTQWSHPSYHHLALGTGSSANREVCSWLLTVCSTATKLQFPTAAHPGFTWVCGMGVQGSPAAYWLSDDLAKSPWPVCSFTSERFLVFYTLHSKDSRAPQTSI